MNQKKTLPQVFLDPFYSGAKLDKGLIIVFVLINIIMLINVSLHDPRVGYDSHEHIKYIEAFSEFRLVERQDSTEFFSPPLPYVLPSLLVGLFGIEILWAAKIAQYLNFFLSLGTTWYLIKICDLIQPGSKLKVGALVFLGLLPVYYKSFAFIRGEPMMVFFFVLIVYYVMLISTREEYTLKNGIILGSAMGLGALSRQWIFFLFPMIFLVLAYKWIRSWKYRKEITWMIIISLSLIIILSGWFYLSLNHRYGSITAFNRPSVVRFAFKNQPWSFYLGVTPEVLFRKPVQPSFPNQFISIFYSEIWGDYWGYYSINGLDPRGSNFFYGNDVPQILSDGQQPEWLQTTYDRFALYLGRVNIVSLFPTLLMLISGLFVWIKTLEKRVDSLYSPSQKKLFLFMFFLIFFAGAGYLSFLLLYPNQNGDTIKATYILYLFPLIAILVGLYLDFISKKSLLAYRLILGILGLVVIHNLPAMITNNRLYYVLPGGGFLLPEWILRLLGLI